MRENRGHKCDDIAAYPGEEFTDGSFTEQEQMFLRLKLLQEWIIPAGEVIEGASLGIAGGLNEEEPLPPQQLHIEAESPHRIGKVLQYIDHYNYVERIR